MVDPVDLEFDGEGRAFLLELRGYPVVAEGSELPGRIVELLDRDRDGRFDERRIFADGFRYADSILPYRGGWLVADAPDLLFVRDDDGDGVVAAGDSRVVLLSGFGVGASESLFNGLRFGPDGWIHGANGSSGGEVFLPDRAQERISIRGRDFRFRFEGPVASPERWRGVFEATDRMGGGFGLDFDDWGRKWVTHEQRHVQAVVVPGRYLPEGHDWPQTTVEISDHGRGGETRIFPISESAPRPNHPEQAGTFTAGCGLIHYGGAALPPAFHDQVFVAEAVHNLVHRDVIRATGSGFVAARAPEEARSELLAAVDPAFRPANMTVGPDGAIWLLDLQRDVIEHPEWIPDDIERELDLYAGNDRGRIYRITGRGGLEVPEVSLGDLESLLEALGHSNRWWRDTARRLLLERLQVRPEETVRVVEALQGLIRSSPEPRARVQALWTLRSLGELDRSSMEILLADPDPRVREATLAAGEELFVDSAELARVAQGLSRDEDARVRLQAILSVSLASQPVPGLAGGAVRVAVESRDDPWLELAAAVVAARQPSPGVASMMREAVSMGPDRVALLAGLARVAGERGREDELPDVLGQLEPLEDEVLAAVLDAMADGLERVRTSFSESARISLAARLSELERSTRITRPGWRVARALELATTPSQRVAAVRAATRLVDREQPLEERLEALSLLELTDPPERIDLLFDLLDVREPSELQSAAIAQLGRVESPRSLAVGERLIADWIYLPPAVRRPAGDILLYRRENHPQLLAALESGRLLIGQLELDLERRRTLLRWSSPEVGERAARLFTDAGVATRAEALERMKPALELAGDRDRGRSRFEELCSRCHRLGELGSAVGPDLADAARKSRLALLHDIVDPNAAVSPEYAAYNLVTEEGEILSGLLVDEDDQSVLLRMALGEEVRLRRSQISELFASGLSLMPEELESGMGPQEMADLLAFLVRWK